MKKIITLFISVLLLFSLLPVQSAWVSANSDENIALGKTPTCLQDRDGYIIANLTDGDPNTYWVGPPGVDGNWVMLDLGEPHVIDSVTFRVRTDTSVDYYREMANLELSNTPDFSERVVYEAFPEVEPATGEPYEIQVTTKTPYRYVRIIKTNSVTLTFSEFEIYGHLPDTGLNVGDDVAGTFREGPVMLLSYLDMMSLKYPEEELFGVDSIFTRGEAASAVVDAFAGNIAVAEEIPFKDVDKSHPYYQAISTAYHMGYITGYSDTAFRPDDYVTKTEFLFMTLRAMGYAEVVQNIMGNDPNKVLNLTKTLKLLRNVDVVNYSDPVTRGDAAVIFYNALLAPDFSIYAVDSEGLSFEEQDTLLYHKHGLVLTKGIVEETCVTTLNGDAKTSRTGAKLGGQAFIDPDGLLNSFLGKEVIVATASDNMTKILLAWSAQTDEEVVLQANKLTSTEADIQANRIMALDADDKDEVTYRLDEKFKVIKNNLAHPYYEDSELMLSNGQLRLLDNDEDGLYEVVFIEEYTLHYVKTAFYDTDELTFIDSEDGRYPLQRDTLSILGADGNSTGANKVKADTVVKLFGNVGGEYSTVIVYNEPVTGTLTTLSETSASVNGVNYPLSLAYQNTVRLYEPSAGEPVNAYVDEAGEILWIERDVDTINDGWTIAYSQMAGTEGVLDPALCFRIFTQQGTWKELYVADKVVVDGITTARAELIKMLNADSGNRFTKTMLRYKTNGTGELNALDTLTETLKETAQGISFNKDAFVASGMYVGSASAFWSEQKQLTLASNTTPTFSIPVVKVDYATDIYVQEDEADPPVYYDYVTDSAFDSLFAAKQLSNYVTTHKAESIGLQSYMPDESGYPACFVKYAYYTQLIGGGSSSTAVPEVDNSNAPYLLVESVEKAMTSEGVVALKLTGRKITSSGLGDKTSVMAEQTLNIFESGLISQELPSYINTNGYIIKGSDLLQYLNDPDASDDTKANPGDLERYTSPATDIGFGDIVRYQEMAETVRAVERVFDYDSQAEPVAGSDPVVPAVWYTTSNNAAHYSAYYRFQLGTLTSANKDAFTITTMYLDTTNPVEGEYNTETYRQGAFSKILVCDTDGKNPELIEAGSVDQYLGTNAKLMLYSYNGQPRLIVVYPY